MTFPALLDLANQAACRAPGVKQDDFFPYRRESAEARRARQTCARCPVKDRCLTEALGYPETVGIWGGTDELDRARIGRRRSA